jgi:hypothetical membrane protein
VTTTSTTSTTTSTTTAADGLVVAPTRQRRSGASAVPVVGIFVLLAGAVAILVLHVVPPTSATSPWRRTISEYAYSSLGWVFNVGVLAVAAGSLIIASSLWASGALRRVSAGSLCLVAWSASLAVLVVFPKHDWSVGPSSHGSIHRAASLIAFASVPLAAIAIGRRRSGRLAVPARTAMTCGIVSAGFLSLLVGAFLLRPLTGTPWYRVFPLGLMERGITAFAVAAIVALGWLALRAARELPTAL